MEIEDGTVRVFDDSNSSSDEVDFQNWLKENPSGYLLNLIKQPKVHRATCDYDMRTTSSRKACGRSLVALTFWASNNEVVDPIPCTLCFGLSPMTIFQQSTSNKADFNPSSIANAQDRILAGILVRQGQAGFRQTLLDAYESRCAFTGCRTVELLDAAHIVPYAGPSTNHVQNGLLLRTDIHTLFDLGLLAVDIRTMTILAARSLSDPDYLSLAGRLVSEPIEPHSRPSRDALELHRIIAELPRVGSPDEALR